MNEDRTCANGGTNLTQGCSGFDLENARRALIAKRVKHGAESAVGHRCSNLAEMLESYPPDWIDYLEPDGVKEQRANLNKSILRTVTELAGLQRETRT